MKFIILMLFILLNTACTSIASSNDQELSDNQVKGGAMENSTVDDLQQALALASESKDYRLLVTSGRSMSIPGIKITDYQMAIELCGKKYNPKAGDVITSEEQRLARKKEINFMRQYNEQMLLLCQGHNRK